MHCFRNNSRSAAHGKIRLVENRLNINNLRYADDTALIAETLGQLQEIIDKVNKEGQLYGVKINFEKAKTMLISKETPCSEFHITVDTGAIKQVDSFVYLGQLLTGDAKCEKETSYIYSERYVQ